MNTITINKTTIPNDKLISYYNKEIYDKNIFYKYILLYRDEKISWNTDDDYPVFSFIFKLGNDNDNIFYSREGIDGYYCKDNYNHYFDKFIDSNAFPFEGILLV